MNSFRLFRQRGIHARLGQAGPTDVRAADFIRHLAHFVLPRGVHAQVGLADPLDVRAADSLDVLAPNLSGAGFGGLLMSRLRASAPQPLGVACAARRRRLTAAIAQ